MVAMHIGKKVNTLTVLALGVGIGVDYAIYLFARMHEAMTFRVEFAAADVAEAAAEASEAAARVAGIGAERATRLFNRIYEAMASGAAFTAADMDLELQRIDAEVGVDTTSPEAVARRAERAARAYAALQVSRDGRLTQTEFVAGQGGHRSLSESYFIALKTTGIAIFYTALTLAVGVAMWIFSDLKFQADMGVMLTFMFVVNMIAAIVFLPALCRWLLRPTEKA
jgi:hypothetical protein